MRDKVWHEQSWQSRLKSQQEARSAKFASHQEKPNQQVGITFEIKDDGSVVAHVPAGTSVNQLANDVADKFFQNPQATLDQRVACAQATLAEHPDLPQLPNGERGFAKDQDVTLSPQACVLGLMPDMSQAVAALQPAPDQTLNNQPPENRLDFYFNLGIAVVGILVLGKFAKWVYDIRHPPASSPEVPAPKPLTQLPTNPEPDSLAQMTQTMAGLSGHLRRERRAQKQETEHLRRQQEQEQASKRRQEADRQATVERDRQKAPPLFSTGPVIDAASPFALQEIMASAGGAGKRPVNLPDDPSIASSTIESIVADLGLQPLSPEELDALARAQGPLALGTLNEGPVRVGRLKPGQRFLLRGDAQIIVEADLSDQS